MRKLNLLLRIGLFALILCLGTGAALVVGETRSLALADLSEASIGAVSEATSDGTLYTALVGDQQGIYRSEDNGYSWQRVGSAPAADISALAVNPLRSSLLYAGTTGQAGDSNRGLLVSDNGGRSWSYTKFALPVDTSGQVPDVSALTISPTQPGVVYIGTEGQGLYRFYNQTGQFEKIGGDSLAQLYVKDIITAPDGQLYAVATEGLLEIDGSRFQKIDTLPVNAISLVVDPTNPKTLYAGTVGYGAYRSDDGGQTWTSMNEGLGWQPGILSWAPAITIDPADSTHLALATGIGVGSEIVSDGIFESFDSGQSWTKVAQSDSLVEHLTIKDGGIYATTAQGLTRYGDLLPAPATTVWSRLASLTHPTGVQALIMLLTLLFAGWILIARLTWMPAWTHKNA